MKAPDSTRSSPKKDSEEQPEVFAVRRKGSLWRMSKRQFLKATMAGAAAGAACSGEEDDENGGDPFPPFVRGGTTYRVFELADYNDELPPEGSNLAVVGYVGNDFYFRYFDAAGGLVVNRHESKVVNQEKLASLKDLVNSVAVKGSAEPAEKVRLAELFTEVAGPGTAAPETAGRRMQGAAGRATDAGRRMQGSAARGSVAGRRMQGSEGRVEAESRQRNLGAVVINNTRYEDTRIVEAYTDGYTKLSHTGGEVVVRSDALPQLVQMQLPVAVPNPSAKPTTIQSRPAPVTPSQQAPARPRTTTYHYWRPN